MSHSGIAANAIGNFAIGISPIGTIPAFDVRQTVISQYGNSARILGLVDTFFQYIDPTQDLDDFFDKVWNIATAEGWGLDVWGRIVGVNRVLQVSSTRFFGFDTTDKAFDPYNVSPFYTGVNFTDNYSLTDDAYRTLILAKALANISDGSIPSLNQLLINLFPGQGNAYVTDDGNMTMTYTFTFIPTPVQMAIITQSNVFPKPVGVAVSIVTP